MIAAPYIGNLPRDPEYCPLPDGTPRATLTVAVSGRKETMFIRCILWRDAATRAVSELRARDRVIIVGELQVRSYETRSGEKRTDIEMEPEDFGKSLKF